MHKKTEVSFVVVSCDKYSDLWEGFFTCFSKYWPDCPFNIYLISNTREFVHPNLTVIKVGPDKSYSDNLLAAVQAVPSEWIILWFDDVFISSRVDNQRLNHIIDVVKKRNGGYLKLSPQMPLSYEGSKCDEIGIIPKGVKYRAAIGSALYRKDLLVKLLPPKMSAWELDVSCIDSGLEDTFYALTSRSFRKPPIRYVHLLERGAVIRSAKGFIKKEGLDFVFHKRKIQSLTSWAYSKLYGCRLSLLRSLKIYWRSEKLK